MFRRDLLKLATALPLSTSISGCWVGRAIGRNASHLVDTPAQTPKGQVEGQEGRLVVTWIGHASMLVQMGRHFVLADPMFMPTIAQLAKRRIEPGIQPDLVPYLDAVVISHMHQDHYSPNSLSRIEKKIGRLLLPDNGLLYAPNADYPARDMTTWERDTAGAVAVTQVPVKHAGWRYGVDAGWMQYAFCGWVFEHGDMTVYFGGDSGYDRAKFQATRARFPHIDVALLAIAPVEPRTTQAPMHMGPKEALDAFVDLGAKVMIPMHYDTFWFGDDAPGDALRVLNEGIQEKRIDPSRVRVAEVGRPLRLL